MRFFVHRNITKKKSIAPLANKEHGILSASFLLLKINCLFVMFIVFLFVFFNFSKNVYFFHILPICHAKLIGWSILWV